MANKEGKWKEIHEYWEGGACVIRVYTDWISVGEIGFNPLVHDFGEIIKEQETKIERLKLAYKKWQDEFEPLGGEE